MYFHDLESWYDFELGECLKHRTQSSRSIYCRDHRETWGKQFVFLYIRDVTIQRGLVFCRSHARVRNLETL